jgi:hypothetical protein
MPQSGRDLAVRSGRAGSYCQIGFCGVNMRVKQSRLLILLFAGPVISVLLVVAVLCLPALAGARNPCIEAGNLTANCGFDTFTDRWQGDKRLQVPDRWEYFILAGSPDFQPSDDTYWGAPSLAIVSDGVNYLTGIYQQVQVTPGVVYQTDIGWAAGSCNNKSCGNMERRLGLDPTGGTNPQAPSVVWSRVEAGGDSWPDLTVSARATGPTMTVFVWVNHPSSSGLDVIYLDAVGLWPDPNQPAATVTPRPSPTSTRRPATATPKAKPPTAVPTESPTAAPTDTEVPTDTATPVDTETPLPTPTWTVTPSPVPPTNTPTFTPPPTLTPLAVARVEQTPRINSALAVAESPVRTARPVQKVLLYIAVAAFAGAFLLGAILLVLWAHSRRAAGEQD